MYLFYPAGQGQCRESEILSGLLQVTRALGWSVGAVGRGRCTRWMRPSKEVVGRENRAIITGKGQALFDGDAAVCRRTIIADKHLIEPAHTVTPGNDQRRDASANSHRQ